MRLFFCALGVLSALTLASCSRNPVGATPAPHNYFEGRPVDSHWKGVYLLEPSAFLGMQGQGVVQLTLQGDRVELSARDSEHPNLLWMVIGHVATYDTSSMSVNCVSSSVHRYDEDTNVPSEIYRKENAQNAAPPAARTVVEVMNFQRSDVLATQFPQGMMACNPQPTIFTRRIQEGGLVSVVLHDGGKEYVFYPSGADEFSEVVNELPTNEGEMRPWPGSNYLSDLDALVYEDPRNSLLPGAPQSHSQYLLMSFDLRVGDHFAAGEDPLSWKCPNAAHVRSVSRNLPSELAESLELSHWVRPRPELVRIGKPGPRASYVEMDLDQFDYRQTSGSFSFDASRRFSTREDGVYTIEAAYPLTQGRGKIWQSVTFKVRNGVIARINPARVEIRQE